MRKALVLNLFLFAFVTKAQVGIDIGFGSQSTNMPLIGDYLQNFSVSPSLFLQFDRGSYA